jgi:hypothetical protein
MSEIAYEAAPAADIRPASVTAPIIHRVWPVAVIAFGIGLTAAWVCLLGYGVAKIIRFAF